MSQNPSKDDIDIQTSCYHCGDVCGYETVVFQEHKFCCPGCKAVFELLSESGLSCYYDINEKPGSSVKNKKAGEFAYLDQKEVRDKLILFSDGSMTSVSFYIPVVHCSSCIYLLENLFRLNDAVYKSTVNFLKCEVKIHFDESRISLRQLAELLTSISYKPEINLNDIEGEKKRDTFTIYYLKLAVAFFCFGNIMLLSFPEYLGLDVITESPFRRYFGYLNILLSLPVLFYSASEFFVSAFNAVKTKHVNLDIPIVLGVIVMFVKSTYDILSDQGAGFMDTLASLVFLMLIGRMFQNRIYHRLSFDRDYRSYFPVAVTIKKDGAEESASLSSLKKGDHVIIHNEEIIPADSILVSGRAEIDYSFVTGESVPVIKKAGDTIYAGGKQVGAAIELVLTKSVSQSYLTGLWNERSSSQPQKDLTNLAGRISTGFTLSILAIAAAAFLYWFRSDSEKAINAFTAVLIITCPCALALSSPFTLGNAMRILGNKSFYLKNGPVVEKLATVDTIVFDKTGTITQPKDAKVEYHGEKLTDYQQMILRSLAFQMNHPVSKVIIHSMPGKSMLSVENYKEFEGRGAEAVINGLHVKAGVPSLFKSTGHFMDVKGTKVLLSIDDQVIGCFSISNKYRDGFEELISDLSGEFKLIVLSGDNDAEREYLKKVLPYESGIFFYQAPHDKRDLIEKLRSKGANVLMIGDGLNDAGALKKSNTGITVSDDMNSFSPACDGILDANSFSLIPSFLRFSRVCRNIIIGSFTLSLIYNLVGIWFAIQGTMSPLVAAILMPLSSVTIISFTTLSGTIAGKMIFKKSR